MSGGKEHACTDIPSRSKWFLNPPDPARIAVNVTALPETTRAVMRKIALLLGMFALTGCAERTTIYLRIDGQDMADNPCPSSTIRA